jgi:hypothetical protein
MLRSPQKRSEVTLERLPDLKSEDLLQGPHRIKVSKGNVGQGDREYIWYVGGNWQHCELEIEGDQR